MNIKSSFSMQWHITNCCDQHCKHCYIYRGNDEHFENGLPLNVLEDILNNFLDFCKRIDKIPHLAITGGDPLLYRDVWKFFELLNSKKVSFGILGNPFHLDSNVVKELKRLGCTSYQMSLDGLRQTHDKIRSHGSFDSTLEALKLLKNNGIRSAIMNTVSNMNISEIPQLVDVIAGKVNSFAFARYCPSPNEHDAMPTPLEYRDFLDKMWNKYNEHKDCGTNFMLKEHLWKLYFYEKGLFNPDSVENPDNLILDGCHCGISHITTLEDGTVYSCRRSTTPIGKVPDESFYDIFFSDAMNYYRDYNEFEDCSKCELKNFCRGCHSVSNGLNGSFYSKDPQCWKFSK